MKNGPVAISITGGTVVMAVLILVAAWLIFELRDLVLVLLTFSLSLPGFALPFELSILLSRKADVLRLVLVPLPKSFPFPRKTGKDLHAP